MENDFVKLLVDACRESMKRNRWILSGVSIASLSIIAGAWNVYFSWLRSIALSHNWGTPNTVEEARKQLVKIWIDSGFLSVPIIGVKIHIADTAFIGSLALSILTLWLFFSIRRENHLVGTSLRYVADEGSDSQKLFAFYGVSSFNVFAAISQSDNIIRSIEHEEKKSKIFGVRGAFSTMFFLPAIAIFFVIFCDVLSMYVLQSPFRTEHSTVHPSILSVSDWIRLSFMELFALSVGLGCFFLGYKCAQYQKGTLQLLREFGREHIGPIRNPSTVNKLGNDQEIVIHKKLTIFTNRIQVKDSIVAIVKRAQSGETIFGQCRGCSDYPDEFFATLSTAVSSGVNIKFILSSHGDADDFENFLKKLKSPNIEFRRIDKDYVRLIGISRKEVIMALPFGEGYFGIGVKNAALSENLENSFNDLWNSVKS